MIVQGGQPTIIDFQSSSSSASECPYASVHRSGEPGLRSNGTSGVRSNSVRNTFVPGSRSGTERMSRQWIDMGLTVGYFRTDPSQPAAAADSALRSCRGRKMDVLEAFRFSGRKSRNHHAQQLARYLMQRSAEVRNVGFRRSCLVNKSRDLPRAIGCRSEIDVDQLVHDAASLAMAFQAGNSMRPDDLMRRHEGLCDLVLVGHEDLQFRRWRRGQLSWRDHAWRLASS